MGSDLCVPREESRAVVLGGRRPTLGQQPPTLRLGFCDRPRSHDEPLTVRQLAIVKALTFP